MVCFSSAAALTLGSHTVPVYEIYKAGPDPHWVLGLDLFRQVTGLPAVIVPHYDNVEGGRHDTRFCYLGERRLALLERDLPDGAFIIGVDEHTAALFDPAERSVRVVGRGGLTLRRGGVSRWWQAGTTLPFTAFVGAVAPGPAPAPPATGTSLGYDTVTDEAAFDACYAARDVDGCVAAALDLEQAMQDWVADTDVSDERERGAGGTAPDAGPARHPRPARAPGHRAAGLAEHVARRGRLGRRRRDPRGAADGRGVRAGHPGRSVVVRRLIRRRGAWPGSGRGRS
ncbi:hypothetical protein OHA72_13755 [Dactylosporangium sp. NBC_01737]|nr:hypothetical protein OHA72_13755 [Dactylosporangium sp. NBC_01737]